MPVAVITPPVGWPVDLDQAKAQLVVEHDDHNDLIEGYIAAATAWLDGPDGYLGRALLPQTLELTADAFPENNGEIALPLPPVVSITSVTYADSLGADQVLGEALWRYAGGYLSPPYRQSWPVHRAQRETVRIRYVAGYADAEAVPAPIKQAILMLVAQWYAAREPVAEGNHAELPFAVSALLTPYRVRRV